MIVEKAVSQWATFWVKRQAVPSSVASAMATVRFIQEMQEICACSGKGRAPALMPALMARETMMLVYNLPQTGAIFDRFGGINGSAYFIGGLRHGTYREQNCCGPKSIRHRSATWSQSRLPEVHRQSHLESVLTARVFCQ